MCIFGSLLLHKSMLEVGQKRMMGVWQAPARSKARVPIPESKVGHRKESFQLPREEREENITQPKGLNSGAEFNAAPMQWFGWVGAKNPLFYLLGGAFLDLIRGFLG